MELKAWVGNLGKYNEGSLVGEWVTFPIDEDEQKALMERIDIGSRDEGGCVYEEIFIADYECEISSSDLGLGEYESIEHLNEVAEALEDADCDDDVFKGILECCSTLDEALEIVRDGDYSVYSDCNTMADVAYEIWDECGYLSQLPKFAVGYIDFEAIGRDMEIEGTFAYCGNGVYVEVIR